MFSKKLCIASLGLWASFALASDLRKFSMAPDAAVAFTNLYATHRVPKNMSASCKVYVQRPPHVTGATGSSPENRIECSVTGRDVMVALPIVEYSMKQSKVESWGSAAESSFGFKGPEAQDLWQRLNKAVWKEFTGRVDASIYYPIVSCTYDESDKAITTCSETLLIDRKIGSDQRSQLFCTRRTDLIDAPEKPGSIRGQVENYDPDLADFSNNALLAGAISSQIESGDRTVEGYNCVIMD